MKVRANSECDFDTEDQSPSPISSIVMTNIINF